MISTKKETSNRSSRFDFTVSEPQVVSAPYYGDDGVEYFGAGQFVLAGIYIEVDGMRQVCLETPGILPASLDGRRAIYRKLERPWINLNQRQVVADHHN